MKVICLAKTGPKGPASRYRIYQYIPHLRERGMDVEVLPAFPDRYVDLAGSPAAGASAQRSLLVIAGFLRRLGHFARAMRADLVVIEREFFPAFPPLFEMLLRVFRRGYILEFDDAIFLSFGRRMKYPVTVKMARRVIVGNEYLARYARQFNDRVEVVPTVVDSSRYVPREDYRLSSPPRIGWVGLPYNFPHLRMVSPALKKVCEKWEARLVVFSGRSPDLPLPVEFVPWSEEREPEVISSFDAGIMPLADTPFARGKCGLKILQYMAAGVPVVASPVGVNRDIISDGVNGFLAASHREWEEKISILLSDENLRERMGREGRKTVEERFDLSLWKDEVARIYLEETSR
ncbi:MAG: glycosyltransferase [Deltaproteobacteria bacterium]|nr:MAG: glycosyltransferase [Deltaproteobacteria bacterium]